MRATTNVVVLIMIMIEYIYVVATIAKVGLIEKLLKRT
jgi:hypothetical protein